MLPVDEVAQIFDAATAKAKDFYDGEGPAEYQGGDFFRSVNAKDGGLPGTDFHTADKPPMDFPSDYRIFVFAARSNGNWNHGDSHGIVSKQRNEVIYFAEDW